MTADLDLCYCPATELAMRIRGRELSAAEAVANSLARIDEVNPVLNCFCDVYADDALAAARDAERRASPDAPPLLGVPVAIKDLTPIAGKRWTRGSFAYEHDVATTTARLVERLVEAGAIVVGKTTLPEFAYSSFTDSPLLGITRNPWDTTRSPGGSSGGSAAAVAAGCVPLAEGTDMGGSVRIPASWSGVVGLKPTVGRIPLEFLGTQFDLIHHFGPLARTVDDARVFLAATQGPDDADILACLPALELGPPLEASADGLRLALCPDLGHYALAPEVEAAVRAAAADLAAAGAVVEEVELAWTRELADAWLAHWGVYLAALFGHLIPEHGERMDPRVRGLMEDGLALGAVEFKRLELVRTRAWQELAPILARHDALLCATMSQTARPVEEDDFVWYADRGDARYHGLDMTCELNYVSQCPVLSVPVGFDGQGLPIGMQVVAKRTRDDLALRIGRALEAVRPWAQARPPL